MDEDIWAEFGKNLVEVKNFDYFPSEWTGGDFCEYFIDYAKEHKKDFCEEKDFPVFESLSNLEKKFVGFLKVPYKKIILNGDLSEADFIFVKSGKIRYLQKDFGEQDALIQKVQVFFDKNFYLEKKYYFDLGEFYNSQESFNHYNWRVLLNNLGKPDEKLIPEDLDIPLVYISRGVKFSLGNGFFSRYVQWSKHNFSLFFYKQPKEREVGYFVFNSKKNLSHIKYIDEINKNPFILKDISKMQSLFKNLKIFPNNLSFKLLSEIKPDKFKKLFL